jgi:bacterioferritin
MHERNSFSSIQALRDKARELIARGPVTANYEGDTEKAIGLLQTVIASELVCVLRYTVHAITVQGLTSKSIAAEFAEHADSERRHMLAVATRIDQLGGTPNLDPEGLTDRAATEYGTAKTIVDMVTDNLVAERLVIEHYRELIRYFGDKDPTTRVLLEGILSDEEEHATDMHDLLVAHQGQPYLAA